MSEPDAEAVEATVLRLARPPHIAVLTTLLADGQPQSHVVWIEYAGGDFLVNTEIHRMKYRNVLRDRRVTVLLIDATDPHCFVEARGRVVETISGERARQQVDALSVSYAGRPYDQSSIRSERVILRIAPDRLVRVTGRTYRAVAIDRHGHRAESGPLPE